ncbi:L,D-transpeptidase family protein [Blautia sp. MSJ-9]|uniref:L,D-transpeptidase family protein n=1 Tax=Blautia sp. MSJ-9 TaxID=2841511 RepID=UPI001C1180B2|nr:L,D-transpeptidase family protein [Blautia sp. MSJ-9]MBU5680651.1 L,D-transpeptidase/peptidoglycan binding protein [Blautia sp. MSJ-9]
MEEKKAFNKKKLKVVLALCIVASVIAGIGLLVYIHHVDTTTLGRKISVYGLDVSKLTVEEAQQKISETFQNKTVTLNEDGEDIYSTSLAQMGYSLDQDVLKSALETLQQQRSQKFQLLALQKDYQIDYQIFKDEAQEQTALAVENFNNKERTDSTDAHIRYSKKKQKYVLVEQVVGNQIDENRLLSFVDDTLDEKFKTELFVSEAKIVLSEDVYCQPDIEASGEMKQQVKKLNSQLKKYRSTTVTYVFGSETQVLDSETISSWLKIKNSGMSIDQDAAANYISEMANKYNTIYVPRTFHTSLGTDITVSDNEYGYRIDQDGELAQLLEDMKSGEDISREPVYSSSGMQRNGTDDLAGSYIEVSLDAQHLWLYKDGALITETDIVSGSPTAKRETYRGAWPIAYKASPFTLSSEEYGYATTVKYWMPFVYGQGLHDASWQSSFGGNRYKTGHGSHGCINLPEDQAALIYNTIDGGYPIIIY